MPDRGQRDDRRDSGRAWDPRSGNDDGRGYGGAPRPSMGGRQVGSQARYFDSQAFQHQPRREATGMRDSGARRDEPPRGHADTWERRHREEPHHRYHEHSRHHGEFQRRYDEPARYHDEQGRYGEPSRHREEPMHCGQNGQRNALYESGSLAQKRKHPDPAASAAPTQRAVGTPSSAQALGRAPPAPSGAVDARALSGRISSAGSTHELLHLSSTHSASLNHIHAANLWNKLGKQRDAAGPRHKEEVRHLLRRTVELVGSCGARELANIAHGLAKCKLVGLDGEAGALFAAVAEAAVRGGLRDFNPQDLANTAWAFATAGHAAPALLDAIATEAVRGGLRDFRPQELTNTAWAFAKAERAAPTLLDAIATEAVRGGMRDFNPQNLTNTAWAFATAGHAAPALLDAIATEAVRGGPREFKPQELANAAWAFAVADHLAPALFDGDAFVQQLCAAERSFSPDELCQLHQWQLWQEERGAAWPPLPPELSQRCRTAFSSKEGVPSRLQLAVVASLQAMGLAPREEVRTEQGYSLDAVVVYGEREVAIEVDGPTHFFGRMRGRSPTGGTALKRRQLRAAGWALLPVPHWEWTALGSGDGTPSATVRAAQQEYLRAALNEA